MSYTLNCKFHEAQTVCLNDVCLLNSAVIINIIPFVIVPIANIHYHTWSVRCCKKSFIDELFPAIKSKAIWASRKYVAFGVETLRCRTSTCLSPVLQVCTCPWISAGSHILLGETGIMISVCWISTEYHTQWPTEGIQSKWMELWYLYTLWSLRVRRSAEWRKPDTKHIVCDSISVEVKLSQDLSSVSRGKTEASMPRNAVLKGQERAFWCLEVSHVLGWQHHQKVRLIKPYACCLCVASKPKQQQQKLLLERSIPSLGVFSSWLCKGTKWVSPTAEVPKGQRSRWRQAEMTTWPISQFCWASTASQFKGSCGSVTENLNLKSNFSAMSVWTKYSVRFTRLWFWPPWGYFWPQGQLKWCGP